MIKQEFVIKAAMNQKAKSSRPRVLLINPPYCRPLGYIQSFFNLGLGYLASVIQQSNYDVAIYNAELELGLPSLKNYTFAFENNYKNLNAFLNDNQNGQFWDELKEVIDAYNPWFIGISVLTNKNTIVENMVKFIKKHYPDMTICLGGQHPNLFPKEIIANKHVDYVITGEAEETIISLLDFLLGKISSLNSVPNIFYKNSTSIKGFIKKNRIKNIDAIPFPLKDSLLGYEEMPSSWFSGIITSRGCPFSCTYCGSKNLFQKIFIERSVLNVINEIKESNRKFGVSNFYFCDDTFNIKKEHALKIAEEIYRFSNKIVWECNIRLDLIDRELLNVFKKNGCNYIWVGIESGSERILVDIKKGYGKEIIKDQIKIIKESGIKWGGYFMIGFPNETKIEMNQTLQFMHQLAPDHAQINIFNPLPGTEIYDKYVKEVQESLISSSINWSLQSQTSLRNIHHRTDIDKDLKSFVLNIVEEFDAYNLNQKTGM